MSSGMVQIWSEMDSLREQMRQMEARTSASLSQYTALGIRYHSIPVAVRNAAILGLAQEAASTSFKELVVRPLDAHTVEKYTMDEDDIADYNRSLPGSMDHEFDELKRIYEDAKVFDESLEILNIELQTAVEIQGELEEKLDKIEWAVEAMVALRNRLQAQYSEGLTEADTDELEAGSPEMWDCHIRSKAQFRQGLPDPDLKLREDVFEVWAKRLVLWSDKLHEQTSHDSGVAKD